MPRNQSIMSANSFLFLTFSLFIVCSRSQRDNIGNREQYTSVNTFKFTYVYHLINTTSAECIWNADASITNAVGNLRKMYNFFLVMNIYRSHMFIQ